MADEINTTDANDAASGNAPKERKTRGPRKSKTVAEAAASPTVSAPAKKTRGPRKNTEASSVTTAAGPATAKKAPSGKVAAKSQPAKRGRPKVETAAPATDGIADLLKLEEENQKLRKALSDKLRSENADLRRKLGIA